MNEQTAITLCLKHRDPIGFEFLVNKYSREALFHARALMRNDEDAADACQESFARAFQAMPRLQQLDNFYPWFYRILRNCCLNMLSRQKTATTYRSQQMKLKEGGRTSENPASLMEENEEKAHVWRAIKTLPPESREILCMKYMQGLCYNEIASILAIPRGTVMSRLYHARKRFKTEYERLNRSGKE